MSAAKHTSGPWIWHEGTPHITRNWNGRVAVIASVDFRLPWHEDRNCEGREQGANGALFAAAPDLLEEHQQWARWIGEALVLALQSDYSKVDELARTFRIGFPDGVAAIKSDAIAKATGSAS